MTPASNANANIPPIVPATTFEVAVEAGLAASEYAVGAAAVTIGSEVVNQSAVWILLNGRCEGVTGATDVGAVRGAGAGKGVEDDLTCTAGM